MRACVLSDYLSAHTYARTSWTAVTGYAAVKRDSFGWTPVVEISARSIITIGL